MHSDSGFTLIELVTTVAVMAVLTAVAIPGFMRMVDNYRLTSAVTDLMVVMQHARLRAAKEFANVVVTFDPDGDGRLDGDYMAFVDSGSDARSFWTHEPHEPIVHQGSLPAGIDIREASFAGGIPRTRFNTLGYPNGFGGHVYLSNRQNRFLGIHINLNGNPRIVKSASGEKGSWE